MQINVKLMVYLGVRGQNVREIAKPTSLLVSAWSG